MSFTPPPPPPPPPRPPSQVLPWQGLTRQNWHTGTASAGARTDFCCCKLPTHVSLSLPSSGSCTHSADSGMGDRQAPAMFHHQRPKSSCMRSGGTWPVHRIPKCVQVGVAGRTGCGKSTLMMALYRLVEPCGGRIIIDGIDICSMGLADLRSRLALVPQARPPAVP